MEERPKVSVIIPTYNRKGLVPEAIDSVIAQTYKDFEVIVIDDGSTDGTGKMLEEKYGDKIGYFYKENGGCASARNYGIRMARGEYISFLDSDDWYTPEKLEDQVRILDNNPQYGFVSSDIVYLDGGQKYLIKVSRPDKNGKVAYPLFLTTYFCLPASLFRRECFDKAGYFDESMRYNEDTDLLLRMAVHCKAILSQRPTYLIAVHKDRKSSDRINLLNAVYESSVKILALSPDLKLQLGDRADSRLAQIKLDIAMEHISRGNFTEALRELHASMEMYKIFRVRIYQRLLSGRLLRKSVVTGAILFIERALNALKSYYFQYAGRILLF